VGRRSGIGSSPVVAKGSGECLGRIRPHYVAVALAAELTVILLRPMKIALRFDPKQQRSGIRLDSDESGDLTLPVAVVK
jgi:hypothetical protein